MKVEFKESTLLGAELVISATEFLKAGNNIEEMESLQHATEAFAGMLGVDYYIPQNEYSAVTDWLDSKGFVIFSVRQQVDRMSEYRWVEIFISNDYEPYPVVYEDESGRHVLRKAKFDPKAKEKIRRRHESEKLRE